MTRRTTIDSTLALAFGALAAFLLISLSPVDAWAATIRVNTTNMAFVNDNKCGLAEALQAVANQASFDGCPAGHSPDTIVVPSGTYVATSSLVITSDVTIQGAGEDNAEDNIFFPGTIIQATPNNFLFFVSEVSSSFSVRFQDLTLDGALATGVRGIDASGNDDGGLVQILRCELKNFTVSAVSCAGFFLDVQDSSIHDDSTPFAGGGIVAFSTLNIHNSSLYNDNSASTGGALYYNGFGTSEVSNSTFSFNSATDGAGLYLHAQRQSDLVEINTSTIAFNNATGSGGGVNSDAFASYTASSTIISNNTDSAGNSDWNGTIASLNGSLLTSTMGTTIGQGSNNLFTDPQLSNPGPSPEDLGGRYHTRVLPLASTSPAIDFLSSVNIQTQDQRSFPRGIRGRAGDTKLFDIGAFEFDPHLQTETMEVVLQSRGQIHSVVSDSHFSNGQGTLLNASKPVNNNPDYVAYIVPIQRDFTIPPAHITVGVKKFDHGGIFTLYFAHKPANGTQLTWQRVGSADLYSKTTTYTTVDLGTQALATDTTYFKFAATGKNSASLGYQLFLDYVDLK
ncbi:MAG: hypothetical protein M3O46_16270 [Myxococcota bacterium]|nr:hypothetical protein [Myxococcota bacterium]